MRPLEAWIVTGFREQVDHFQRLAYHGLLETMLYSYKSPSFGQFKTILDKSRVLTVYDTGQVPVGIAWFDNCMCKLMWSHFCLYPAYQHEATKWANIILAKVKSWGIHTLMGITPKPYRHARKFITQLGFEQVATLPQACYLAKQDRYTDGILSMRTL